MGTANMAHWHRRALRPRPVLVVEQLPVKVRVLDLVDSTRRRLVFREVYPSSLTHRHNSRTV